jgi:type I restriction-modification system DNA methylase subunit
MALFNPRTLKVALDHEERLPTRAELDAAQEWVARATSHDLDLQSESQLEQEFNRLILQQVLSYSAPGAGQAGTMRVKQPIPGGTIVDVALGHFDGAEAEILAPFELKGPKVPLDRIMPGRNKTPVQQAWDYAMDAPGARWVLLSNMKEVRLYAVGHGRLDYETFDLRRLGEPDQLARFQLLLHAANLLGGSTAELLRRSAQADRDITNALYRDYRSLRGDLLQFVRDQRPDHDAERRIHIVQTLLDRLLFVAFAEDSFLLPENSLRDAITFHDRYAPRPKWKNVCKLFEWVNVGAADQNIPPYNGGLFRSDSDIDGLDLPDPLVERFLFLSEYDFRSEISVTILGHIFEQSISDIEAEKAEARAPSPIAGKRKREGVVYTPDFVTRFIVEQTIGKHLSEASEMLLPRFGKRGPGGEIKWRSKAAEADYWRIYLDRLTSLRILDPACGSGAFLIAAFDFLNVEQKRVRERLSEFERGILVHARDTADVDIITNNLFGVDVNAESVEITRLALWLKTAKRQRKLASLNDNIKWGNSLVDSADVHPHPFDWPAQFPTILDGSPNEGFDIVLGNPPYVRMELLKDIKSHLEARFAVAADRADLYAYFFELGVKLLRPGGRMGYISSSTFFRTGSGKPLRAFLAEHAQVESVVDFGDLPVFEGVTTYPAILVLRKPEGDSEPKPDLSYLNTRAMPEDLSKSFDDYSLKMSCARLGPDTWRFESDLLDAIRAKMASGRPTLADEYGAPLYGIKTGFNRAFVLTRRQRDDIVARAGPADRSADLLKPFLVGDNIERWHVESDDLWLIYTPKNRIEITDYPSLRQHLAPFRERLERRATQQNWWELQQAQGAYEPHFESGGVLCPDISQGSKFSRVLGPVYPGNTIYMLPGLDVEHAGYLNSRLVWFFLLAISNALRGGQWRLRMQTQYLSRIPIATDLLPSLKGLSQVAHDCSTELWQLKVSVRRRLGDISASVVQVNRFLDWTTMSFSELQALLKKRCNATIPVDQRDEWEGWFEAQKANSDALASSIAEAEAEIDARVYHAFGLSRTEIAAVEDALAIASPSLDVRSYEAVSAVEGLSLSSDARAALNAADGSPRKRRSASLAA